MLYTAGGTIIVVSWRILIEQLLGGFYYEMSENRNCNSSDQWLK